MENNNYSPEQNGYNGQFPQQNQYNGQYAPGYNQQYNQPQYNNSYNQQYNQPYGQQYNQPYGQQYGQPYGYNQGGFTVAPQKKPINPVIMAIPAAVIPTLLAVIYNIIAVRTIEEVSFVLGLFLNVATIAIIGGCGFITYKKPKGAATFLGCYFIANCVACVPTDLLKAFTKSYRAQSAMTYVALFLTIVLTIVAVMVYEKLKDNYNEEPASLKLSADSLKEILKTKKGLYNPLFIGVAVFAITFINRVSGAILNSLRYNINITTTALGSMIINILAVGMIIGAGFLMTKSFKKAFELGGYACIAFKLAFLIGAVPSVLFGENLILNLFLSLIFSAIGAALATGFAFVAEGNKKKNIF